MQDRVLDAANVLIDACASEPVARDLAVEGSLIVVCVGVAVEIPGGIDKRIHGVGLAQRWAATLRTPGIKKFRTFANGDPPLSVISTFSGKRTGKSFSGT